MGDFTTVLPFETITSILSYINQNDCCECMRVCRRWNDQFPSYTKSTWNTLRISFNSWRFSNMCLIRCLGPHVQIVSMFMRDPCPLLKGLRDTKCGIISLDIRTHVTLREFSPLLLRIVPFHNTLKELAITNYSFDIPILRLLSNLPNLTHLTLLLDFQTGIQIHESPNDNVRSVPTKIVYLHLDNAYSFETRIAPVLEYCPQLKALLVSRDFEREPYYDITKSSNYINTAIKICPQLRYIAWNTDNNCTTKKGSRPYLWHEMAKNDCNGKLRELMLFGSKEDMDHIIPLLSQNGLEHIQLVNDQDGIAWNALADISFPRLKTATLHGLKLTAHDCTKFLSGCHDLEKLHLATIMDNTQLIPVVKMLGTMKHLHYLQLDRQLTSSLMSHLSPHLFDTFSDVGLRTVKLYDICVMDPGLLALSGIRSLRELDLGMNHHQSCIGHDALLTFALRLKETNSRLSILGFSFLATITDQVLERLALVKSLTSVSVTHNSNISMDGIKVFVESGKRKFRVSMCSSVSSSGIYEKESFE